jgi:hypothetical protein
MSATLRPLVHSGAQAGVQEMASLCLQASSVLLVLQCNLQIGGLQMRSVAMMMVLNYTYTTEGGSIGSVQGELSPELKGVYARGKMLEELGVRSLLEQV